MERWERRERKQQAKRRRMGVSGRGLITVIRPVVERRAEEARRAREERDKGGRGSE